ncbi:MAG: TrbI/VirB10 family protein [Novosphingobium sp.]|nr:TrbI/VirB10 family protein [Novosphingobium sp.]
MAPNSTLRERSSEDRARDPREAGEGAEIIDLATRTVLPVVSQRKRGDGLGLVAGIAIVAALGGLTLWSMNAAREDATQQASSPAPVRQVAAVPAPAQPGVLPQVAPAPQEVQPSPVLAAPPQAASSFAVNPHSSPTVTFDASALPGPVVAALAPTVGAAGKGNSNEDFAARLGGLGNTTATAAANFDPATTVTQGTLIPAVLETAINTDVPGFVRAIVSADVRSFDGRHVLVPRSSRLIGQYKSGLSAGQKRAYVIWTRVIRPDGVSVNLGSPAIGFGGETGLAGKVNSHFFSRFGSALLLSVVGGLSAIGGNSGVIIAGGGQSAAAAAVNQNGQMGPTIRVRQGEPIRVFTAKDLDFSKVQ